MKSLRVEHIEEVVAQRTNGWKNSRVHLNRDVASDYSKWTRGCERVMIYQHQISNCYSTGANWEPGVTFLRIVPWTGDIATQQDQLGVTPVASLLPGCQHYMLYVEPHRADENSPGTVPTNMQRQARVIVFLQYKQEAEPQGTPHRKPNYNQAPLQIFSSVGRDDTTWRGLFLNLTTSVINNTTAMQSIFIPFAVKYTVAFSGRRWLPATPTANYRLNSSHLLGPDVLGSESHVGEGTSRIKFYGQSGVKHTGLPESHVHQQSRAPQTLASKDEPSDKEKPVSTDTSTDMLDQPFDRHAGSTL